MYYYNGEKIYYYGLVTVKSLSRQIYGRTDPFYLYMSEIEDELGTVQGVQVTIRIGVWFDGQRGCLQPNRFWFDPSRRLFISHKYSFL